MDGEETVSKLRRENIELKADIRFWRDAYRALKRDYDALRAACRMRSWWDDENDNRDRCGHAECDLCGPEG